MGFFSKLFSVTSCRNCGSTDLQCINQLYGSNCKLMACRKCNKVYVYGQAPLCANCDNLCEELHIIAAVL